MNKTYLQLLKMIKASLYNEKLVLDKDETIDWIEILRLAQIHKIVPLIYESTLNIEEFKQLDLQQNWLTSRVAHLIIWRKLKSLQ